jgi:hypothetical protein
METIEQHYTYEQLTPTAQEKVLEWWGNVSWDDNYWSECVIDCAKEDGYALGFVIDNIYWSGFWSQGDGARWGGRLFHTWGKSAPELHELSKKQREIADEVTAEEFKKAMTTRLLSVANLKTGTVKTPWGQFMDTIPRYYFT